MVRFQWYGLYHDKPKVGYFMMRIKIPAGILTPAQLRVIGELSDRFGRDYGELTTRQNDPAPLAPSSTTCPRSSRRWRASG